MLTIADITFLLLICAWQFLFFSFFWSSNEQQKHVKATMGETLYICQCVGFRNFSHVHSFGQQLVRSVSLMNNWLANQNGDSWLLELYIYQSTLVLQTMLKSLILIPSRLCYVQCWQGWRHISNDWYKIKREYSTDLGPQPSESLQ